MSTHPDVLVLGGGVIGLSTAYYLGRAGARVTVVDRGDLGRQASWAGAGIISPGNPGLAQTPYHRFRAFSSCLYPALSNELRERTGIDNGYVVCGGVEFAQDGDGNADDEWRTEGIAFRRVQGAELQRLFPGVHPGVSLVYHLPDMAQVRNPWHLKALQAACEQQGVDLRPGCAVVCLRRGGGDHIESAETAAGPLSAGRYLVAAGAWSEGLLEPLGWRPGIRPVRGQIALLDTGVRGVRPVLLLGKRYLVPRTDGRLLVGSTEEDAGFDARPTAGGVGDLLAFAASIVPALAEAPLERCWAGLRPGSPDGMPFLGRVPGYGNLFVAAGHFRAGLQLSPATGLVLSELLLDRPPSVPVEAFRPDRASAGEGQAAFRS
jgi:glycine oxidase